MHLFSINAYMPFSYIFYQSKPWHSQCRVWNCLSFPTVSPEQALIGMITSFYLLFCPSIPEQYGNGYMQIKHTDTMLRDWPLSL